MKNLRLLFLSAVTLSSVSVCALAAQGDPLAGFPTGLWTGTYDVQNCTTGKIDSGIPAQLFVKEQTIYTPGTPSSVTFNGVLTLENFPGNYNSYASGVNLKDNQSIVIGVSSPYMTHIVPEKGDMLAGNYFSDSNVIKVSNLCSSSAAEYGVGITLHAP